MDQLPREELLHDMQADRCAEQRCREQEGQTLEELRAEDEREYQYMRG